MEKEILYFNPEHERVVFHFNKASITDKTVPMWVIKSKGETFYVDHVDSFVGFSTKETPLNPHTQGSIQFKGVLLIFEHKDGRKTAAIHKEYKVEA